MGVVRYLPDVELPADVVLEAAVGKVDKVLVIGSAERSVEEGGGIFFYYAGTTSDKAVLLYWMEQFKHDLLNGVFDQGE